MVISGTITPKCNFPGELPVQDVTQLLLFDFRSMPYSLVIDTLYNFYLHDHK